MNIEHLVYDSMMMDGLSCAEVGVYSRLIDCLQETDRPLPDDLPQLYRICRATTADERDAVHSVVKRFFPSESIVRRNLENQSVLS